MKNFLYSLIPNRLKPALVYSKFKYAKDGLYTFHIPSFLKDKKFTKAYEAGKSTQSWGSMDVEWRLHTILWAVQKCIQLEGEFVECGTNKGGFAKAIVDYLNFNSIDKKFYLFDTFRGLDLSKLSADEKNNNHFTNIYSDCYEDVKNTFREFENVLIVKGSVPDTLSQFQSEKVAFLSIDMNCVQPEIEALNFFWDKLVHGGVIVLDDYAYTGCEAQNAAHNEWASNKKIQILSLPTGQGLIVK